ncbi:hypothetical protein Bca101_006773 [Brassica carinata]
MISRFLLSSLSHNCLHDHVIPLPTQAIDNETCVHATGCWHSLALLIKKCFLFLYGVILVSSFVVLTVFTIFRPGKILNTIIS